MEVGTPVPEAIKAATEEAEATTGVRKGVPKAPVAVPTGNGLLLLVLVALVAGTEEVPAILVALVATTTVPILAVEATDVVAMAEAPVQGRPASRAAVVAEDAPRLGVATPGLQVPVAAAAAVAVP